MDNNGKFADLLWSDPCEDYEGFRVNQRGAGTLFGIKVVQQFCQRNDIDLIVRSHQLVQEGYGFPFKDKYKENKELVEYESKLVTLWSVPNYCYRCANKAMFLRVSKDLTKEYVEFKHDPVGAKTPLTKMTPYFL